MHATYLQFLPCHTNTNTYIHTYIHVGVHACIHTYIHARDAPFTLVLLETGLVRIEIMAMERVAECITNIRVPLDDFLKWTQKQSKNIQMTQAKI